MYDDNGGGRFAPAAAVLALIAAYGLRTSSRGISRDILVEAMFRIEAAGYPIVLHVHDECVCEVPIGFGDEQEFVRLMTQPPSWAPDLPIAANAWRGYRYDKQGTATAGAWTSRRAATSPQPLCGTSNVPSSNEARAEPQSIPDDHSRDDRSPRRRWCGLFGELHPV